MGGAVHDRGHDGLGSDAFVQGPKLAALAGPSSPLHTLVYVIDRGTLDRIVEALPRTEIWTGWLAMLIFVPLAITSNNASQRWLHTGWKTLQRMAYPAAVLVLIHWAALHNWGSWPPAAVHFGPLVGLWAYRLWYWYLRQPARRPA
ncbi:MAG: hypothetical protein NTW20_04550 [Rhodobacterales bacterium]|nr:hypothetical protein [Rhodobacterales bacterium]